MVIDSGAEFPSSVAYHIPATRQYMSITAPSSEFYKKLTGQLTGCRDYEAVRREQEEARRRAEREAERKRAEEEAARRRAEEAARLKAEREAARQREKEEIERRKAQKELERQRNAAGSPGSSASRRPLGIIAIAAALVAAIVLGVVFIPRLGKNDDTSTTESVQQTEQDTQQEEQNTQQADSLPYLTELSSVAVGDHVLFGSYPQMEDGQKQPVEWLILNIEDGKALMLSEYLLDYQEYDVTNENYTWETCTLRKWLNDDFYNTAFSVKDQNKIVLKTNDNPDNATYGTEGGNSTDDKVFCLSIDEGKKYFIKYLYDDAKAKPTAYANKNRAHVSYSNGNGDWWLRSPGFGSNNAAYVNSSGTINGYGDDVYCHYYVRPVVLVSLQAG